MKKTLIALLALAGMASGATTFTWDASQEYSYTWDFSATNTQNGQIGVLGGTVTNTFTTEDVANAGTAIKGELRAPARSGGANQPFILYWSGSSYHL